MENDAQGPLIAAVTLGEFIRSEHGREGVHRYVQVLAALVPHGLIVQVAKRLNTEVPPPLPPLPVDDPPSPSPPPKRENKSAGNLSPEQLIKLMQNMGKGTGGNGTGGGLDPAMLISLLK